MKKSGFSKPNYKEWIAKQKLKTRSVKPKTPPKLKARRVNKQTYYKELLSQNKWVSKIPLGSHGSTPLQKKLWKLTTDYVRIRDFINFGNCHSCNKSFDTWQESQGGHYRSFTSCKGYTKFSYMNVFAQCAFCNSRMNDDKFEGGRIFAHNIIKRFGQAWFDEINTFPTGKPVKLEIPVILDMMKEIITLMEHLPIKTDYYNKITIDK